MEQATIRLHNPKVMNDAIKPGFVTDTRQVTEVAA